MCESYIITIGCFIFVETRVVDKSDTLQVQLTMTEAFLKIKLFFVFGYRCIGSGNLTNSYIQIGIHLSSLRSRKEIKEKKYSELEFN